MTDIIDGKQMADEVVSDVREDVLAFEKEFGCRPGLAVVIVGEDPASQVYVRNKVKRATEAGLQSIKHELPSDTSQEELNHLVDSLNDDDSVHGILVQLPLPKHLDEQSIIHRIAAAKDVDGFHPLNVGALNSGGFSLVPCTPQGCLIMLQKQLGNLSGKHAVVVGRSNIVGKPMAALLLANNCTVTVVHSRTPNPDQICRQADIVVAAVGKPKFINKSWLKPGAVVIDVGINAVDIDGKRKLVGDVDYNDAFETAAAITPVPGGVGPMTIACLMKNTLIAAKAQLSES